jgi:hypothetical protein
MKHSLGFLVASILILGGVLKPDLAEAANLIPSTPGGAPDYFLHVEHSRLCGESPE